MNNDNMTMIGSLAPNFTLKDDQGKDWRLADHRGRIVVLLFYPGDDTPVCTRQMRSLRNHWQEYQDTGAEVVGISTDDKLSHQRFITKYGLPVKLLSDPARAVIDLYGARSLIPGKVARSVFVIDANGIIRHRDVRPIGFIRPKDSDILQAIRAAQR